MTDIPLYLELYKMESEIVSVDGHDIVSSHDAHETGEKSAPPPPEHAGGSRSPHPAHTMLKDMGSAISSAAASTAAATGPALRSAGVFISATANRVAVGSREAVASIGARVRGTSTAGAASAGAAAGGAGAGEAAPGATAEAVPAALKSAGDDSDDDDEATVGKVAAAKAGAEMHAEMKNEVHAQNEARKFDVSKAAADALEATRKGLERAGSATAAGFSSAGSALSAWGSSVAAESSRFMQGARATAASGSRTVAVASAVAPLAKAVSSVVA